MAGTNKGGRRGRQNEAPKRPDASRPSSGKPRQKAARQSAPAAGGQGRDRTSETKPRRSPEAPRKTEAPVGTEETAARPLIARAGPRPDERVPLILEIGPVDGYALVDSGNGEKLERYGPYLIVRPEAQALWPRRRAESLWAGADAVFTGDTDEDGMGRWRFPREALGETWPMRLLDVDFLGRFTAFRHVGVFPEQMAHWSWMQAEIAAAKAAGRRLRVLNLFGYTGVASLVAAAAGAEVTHVDASKRAIGWARENQALARLEDRPIRWICDDAMKFIQREERRGRRYDIILTDPPKFGRGPQGEVWQLFDHLPLMLDIGRELLTAEARGLVLTAYSIRASFYAIHELMRETMRGMGGRVESGELVLRSEPVEADGATGPAISTSLFSRWVPA